MLKKLRSLFRPAPIEEVPVGEITVSAVVIRADGTREDLGVISRGPAQFVPTGKEK